MPRGTPPKLKSEKEKTIPVAGFRPTLHKEGLWSVMIPPESHEIAYEAAARQGLRLKPRKEESYENVFFVEIIDG